VGADGREEWIVSVKGAKRTGRQKYRDLCFLNQDFYSTICRATRLAAILLVSTVPNTMRDEVQDEANLLWRGFREGSRVGSGHSDL
jgi:hypothetical protein